MNNNCELDARLEACASFVRRGSVCADIGSDHAYLPIYLVKHEICPRAIASDINEGPVKRAKINVALSDLSDKIDVICADGLDKACLLSPSDIVIAGMGGELIRDIIATCEYVKDKNIRLILQPMTMPEVLRCYLAENGFSIIDEKLCTAAGKCYAVICAEYDGGTYELEYAESHIGPVNLKRMESGNANGDDIEFLKRTKASAARRVMGMSSATHPDTDAIKRNTRLEKTCEKLLELYKEV